MSKHTLVLAQSLPFSASPRFAELEDKHIFTNDVRFPWETHPIPLWVIGGADGPEVAIWAECEQDAFDEMVDRNHGDWCAVADDDLPEEGEEPESGHMHLGNYGKLHDLDSVWIAKVEFDKVRDFDLLLKLAEARGAGAQNLDMI